MCLPIARGTNNVRTLRARGGETPPPCQIDRPRLSRWTGETPHHQPKGGSYWRYPYKSFVEMACACTHLIFEERPRWRDDPKPEASQTNRLLAGWFRLRPKIIGLQLCDRLKDSHRFVSVFWILAKPNQHHWLGSFVRSQTMAQICVIPRWLNPDPSATAGRTAPPFAT